MITRVSHELKTWPQYFQEVKNGQKTFEVRNNDRDFKEGDFVNLKEFDPIDLYYTGEELLFRIGFVLTGGFGIEEGHCVFSLLPV